MTNKGFKYIITLVPRYRTNGGITMAILNVKADNLLIFNNFEMNLTYPKKLVNSGLDNEVLEGHPKFRYNKVVVLMGANATGKTCFGKLLKSIFNFIVKKEHSYITGIINNTSKSASFSIDFAINDFLYRVKANIDPMTKGSYTVDNITASVRCAKINKADTYEKCVEKIEIIPCEFNNYQLEFEKVPRLGWMFKFTNDDVDATNAYRPVKEDRYLKILNRVLKVLDPRIDKVSAVENTVNTYNLTFTGNSRNVIIDNGKILNDSQLLSSGTKESIGVAQLIAGIKTGQYGFFYCDEKFSHIHSDSEKAFISLLIECLNPDDQLFVTSHNKDLLDMGLPFHSFIFLKRDYDNGINCVYPGDYLKKNTDSLKRAVENDLFGAEPDLGEIYNIYSI